MTSKARGTICGIAAAMSYGCNPFALFLYAMGISVNSVLSYRYGIATLVLGLLMLLRRRPLRITRRQTALTAALGILFAGSSLTLFLSFRFIDAGLASTMLFIYPVLVAVIMALFFGERLRPAVAAAIILAITGVAFLCDSTVIGTGDIRGVLLVMLSSLLYAVYMVIVKVSRIALPADTLTYHVLAWGTVAIVAFSLIAPSEPLQLLHGAAQWGWAIFLALVPTVISKRRPARHRPHTHSHSRSARTDDSSPDRHTRIRRSIHTTPRHRNSRNPDSRDTRRRTTA